MDAESGEDENMTWQVHEGDKNGEADEMNVEDDSKDEVMHIWEWCVVPNEENWRSSKADDHLMIVCWWRSCDVDDFF